MNYDSIIKDAGSKDCSELLNSFFAHFNHFTDEEVEAVRSAWLYLCQVSKDKFDSQNLPYHIHALRVACILAERDLDCQCIVAGFLHNVLSFEKVSEDEIREKFGPTILKLIGGTTRITNLKINNKTQQEADSVRKMLFAMVEDIRVILVMLADRLDRIRNLSHETKLVQKQVAQEAIDIWAPLANRLGMSSVKSELEDLSLKYSNPDVYGQIKKVVAAKKQERADYLSKAQQEIYKAANRAGLEVTISSRAKHFYSIYQKMRKRNKAVDELLTYWLCGLFVKPVGIAMFWWDLFTVYGSHWKVGSRIISPCQRLTDIRVFIQRSCAREDHWKFRFVPRKCIPWQNTVWQAIFCTSSNWVVLTRLGLKIYPSSIS